MGDVAIDTNAKHHPNSSIWYENIACVSPFECRLREERDREREEEREERVFKKNKNNLIWLKLSIEAWIVLTLSVSSIGLMRFQYHVMRLGSQTCYGLIRLLLRFHNVDQTEVSLSLSLFFSLSLSTFILLNLI